MLLGLAYYMGLEAADDGGPGTWFFPSATIAAAAAGSAKPRDFACERFSTGHTKGLPAQVVRCRWTESDAVDGRRCAYVHYEYRKKAKLAVDVISSAIARGGSCDPGPAFRDLIRAAGYSGQVPD
jgi:hypothetical protein